MFKAIVGTPSEDDDLEPGYGYEFIPVMLSFFQNCISFGGNDFFQFEHEGDTPFSLLVKCVSHILKVETNMGGLYSSSVCCMKLVGTILENCAGKIDTYLGDFIALLQKELEERQVSKIYKSGILQAFSMCFVYDTKLTYKYLEEQGQTEHLLKFYFSNMNIFTKTYEVRRVLYGIA